MIESKLTPFLLLLGMPWKAIQIRTVKVIKIRLGKSGIHFESVRKAKYRQVAPPLTRQTVVGGYTKVASYGMLSEQIHHSNPIKRR